jgi:hypothetical protein
VVLRVRQVHLLSEKVKALIGGVNDPTPALREALKHFRRVYHDQFAAQGRPAGSWAPRMTGLPGILQAISEGRKPSDRVLKPRLAGVVSGTLRRRMRQHVHRRRIVLSFVAPHAEKFHGGGPSEGPTMTPGLRKKTGDYLKTKGLRDLYGWALNRKFENKRHTFDVIPRPLVEWLPEDDAALERIIGTVLTGKAPPTLGGVS